MRLLMLGLWLPILDTGLYTRGLNLSSNGDRSVNRSRVDARINR